MIRFLFIAPLTMIHLDLDDGHVLFGEFIFKQELKKLEYNQPILFDNDDFLKELIIKSIAYGKIKLTCKSCGALH